MIRVVIADDHPLMRSGVHATLVREVDIDVVGEASDGREAQALCAQHRPHVLVLDLNMPGPSFLETVEHLQEQENSVAVLVLTAHNDSMYVRSVIKAGAAGYVLKDEVPDALVNAVRTIHGGGTWFSRAAFVKLHEVDVDRDLVADLTKREREVLTLVARGRGNTQIAETLDLAEQTVRNYVSRIYAKVGVSTRVELAVWAREHHLSGE